MLIFGCLFFFFAAALASRRACSIAAIRARNFCIPTLSRRLHLQRRRRRLLLYLAKLLYLFHLFHGKYVLKKRLATYLLKNCKNRCVVRFLNFFFIIMEDHGSIKYLLKSIRLFGLILFRNILFFLFHKFCLFN